MVLPLRLDLKSVPFLAAALAADPATLWRRLRFWIAAADGDRARIRKPVNQSGGVAEEFHGFRLDALTLPREIIWGASWPAVRLTKLQVLTVHVLFPMTSNGCFSWITRCANFSPKWVNIR